MNEQRLFGPRMDLQLGGDESTAAIRHWFQVLQLMREGEGEVFDHEFDLFPSMLFYAAGQGEVMEA